MRWRPRVGGPSHLAQCPRGWRDHPRGLTPQDAPSGAAQHQTAGRDPRARGDEDVLRVAQDWQTFSSAQGVSVPGNGKMVVPAIPEHLDPPLHRTYKRLINAHFTPAVVARYEAPTRDLVTRLIDEFVEHMNRSLDVLHPPFFFEKMIQRCSPILMSGEITSLNFFGVGDIPER